MAVPSGLIDLSDTEEEEALGDTKSFPHVSIPQDYYRVCDGQNGCNARRQQYNKSVSLVS